MKIMTENTIIPSKVTSQSSKNNWNNSSLKTLGWGTTRINLIEEDGGGRIETSHSEAGNRSLVILLVEEILHHLGCIIQRI